jgi:oligopeptide/dipeptide ABC transporter ATP-binding protein
MPERLLSVEGLGVAIDGRDVLSDVWLSVGRGEAVGLVGETGSGKTMTARVLTGTLSRVGGRVVAGTAHLGDLELTTLPERGWRSLRGHRIALVPQSSQSGLDPRMTVRAQLVETIRTLSPSAHADTRAKQLLESVSLPTDARILKAYGHELSGGMRQRVMIALALAGDAELLIGDEPTTALDVTVQHEILSLLKSIRDARGQALVLISHDLAVVEDVADGVVIMYAGQTVESGPTRTVFAQPKHPYTSALLRAIPRNASRDVRLANIPGAPPTPGSWPVGCRFAPRCAFAVDACKVTSPQLRAVGHDHMSACLRAGELSL